MRKAAIVVFFLFLTIQPSLRASEQASVSHSASQEDGVDSDKLPGKFNTQAAACFDRENNLPTYLEVTKSAFSSPREAATALAYSCGEFDPSYELGQYIEKNRSLLRRLYATTLIPVTGAVSFDIPTLISSDILGGGEQLKVYKLKLDPISRIENRIERIKRTMELAVRSQGRYGVTGLISTPQQVLEDAQKDGTGGVCRDFAALLAWSLMQVQKSPTLSKQHELWGSLDENSFSVTKVANPDHIWIEISLPVKSPRGGMNFKRFHLDTTWYSSFVPLNPRHDRISPSRNSELHSQCERVRRCLSDIRNF